MRRCRDPALTLPAQRYTSLAMPLAIPFPVIDPVLIEIGPFAIRWYALAYIGGLMFGWIYGRRLIAKTALWNVPPGDPVLFDDLIVWVAFGIILGGRLGHVLIYDPAYYFDNPVEILQVWRGGMSFHGGLIGATLAIIIFAWRHGVPILSYLDIAAAVTPIGLFLGRIANFINAELWGRVSDVPWAMVFPNAGPEPRHPSQIYEAALEGLLLFIVLNVMARHGALKRPGLLTGAFGIGYGLARSLAELFREPDGQVVGPITTGMALSIPLVVVGIVLVWNARRAELPA
jgi:phosphatidylglycerol:prolipoprotein diacylglycerol transferase